MELEVRKRVNDLTSLARQFISDEDPEQLKQTLDELRKAIDDKHYKKKKEANKFYDEAHTKLKSLQRKHKLMKEIEEAWKKFVFPFDPEYLENRKEGIAFVNQLKDRSIKEGDGAFSEKDDENLRSFVKETEDLENKTKRRDEIHNMMREAMRKYSYKFITMALTEAEGAFFLDQNLHQECRELGDFLNPKNRIQALLNSLESHNMDEVSKAIDDYKKAGVKDPSGPDLIKKAKQRLLHLKKVLNLNEELRKSMKSENKKKLREILQRCHGFLGDKSKDIPLYGEAEKQFKDMESGDFQYSRHRPN